MNHPPFFSRERWARTPARWSYLQWIVAAWIVLTPTFWLATRNHDPLENEHLADPCAAAHIADTARLAHCYQLHDQGLTWDQAVGLAR